ncbi:hypothetical protein LBMAG53_35770 [Planctomycetota bacterium]|nr:hypothetical protein LBMAG53_35770 [Planctomycetota bacterium]
MSTINNDTKVPALRIFTVILLLFAIFTIGCTRTSMIIANNTKLPTNPITIQYNDTYLRLRSLDVGETRVVPLPLCKNSINIQFIDPVLNKGTLLFHSKLESPTRIASAPRSVSFKGHFKDIRVAITTVGPAISYSHFRYAPDGSLVDESQPSWWAFWQ